LLQFFERGENKVVNGTQCYTEDSENVYAVNLAKTIEAQSTKSQALILVLPRTLISDELPHLANACGALFKPRSFSARIFIDYMKSLRSNLPYAKSEDTAAIVESTLGLLDALTLHDDVDANSVSDAAFRSACRHIERHLGDPGLAVDGICKHLRCSRATLYRLFQPHGGVHQHIQNRRLAACFKAIRSPRYRHRRVYDIALDFGFSSPSHFSNLFRSHFGMTPSEAREMEVRSPKPPVTSPNGAASDAERMWIWAKTLAQQTG